MKFILTSDGVIQRAEDWPQKADWLELSIQKLQFIVDCVEAGMVVHNCGGSGTCGLCHYSRLCEENGVSMCTECLIAQSVGQRRCMGTPYEQWVSEDGPITLELAREWLKFLEELR